MTEETHQAKRIHLATDHAGLALKDSVKDWLLVAGHEVVDHGSTQFDAEDDFPDFIAKAVAAVSKKPDHTIGIIFGGSGQGEAMVANRFPQVRATAYYGGSEDIITLSRTHNDANVLSIGARFVETKEIIEMIDLWLKTPFTREEKRVRRNQKIEHVTKSVS